MKNKLLKHIFMKIKDNYKRFLSLLCMALLGVGFYAGIQAASPDMIKTLDNFKNGFKIKNSGGFQIWYNDSDKITKAKVVDYQGKEAITEYTGYSCMIARDYEIGLSDDQIKNYTVIDEIAE